MKVDADKLLKHMGEVGKIIMEDDTSLPEVSGKVDNELVGIVTELLKDPMLYYGLMSVGYLLAEENSRRSGQSVAEMAMIREMKMAERKARSGKSDNI